MRGAVRGLKVCHVFAGAEGGRWVVEQLQALMNDHGCDVHAVLGGTAGSTVDLCREAGIPVRSLDFSFGGWPALFSIPWRILCLAWWMRRERFDVVQSHVIQSTLFARPAAWLADVPVRLVMVTGPFYMQAKSSRWMELATVFMETGVIPSCDLTGSLYREAGTPASKLLPTLYYGPPADRWDPARTRPAGLREELGLAPQTPLIGSVAIFYPRCAANSFVPPDVQNRHVKGHVEMVMAMPAVLAAFPDAKLVLIGKSWGSPGEGAEAELRALVRAEGLDGAVIFAGYRPDIPEVYLDLDVSVQASLNDNLGGTVESLLMERPTVATRVGGLVDSVRDGETGLLVPPGDAQALAAAIVRLLADPEEGRRLGTAGRALMLSRFTLETTARRLAELYAGQRRGAGGAWRLHRSAGRLAVGALLHPPVLGRALVYDLFLLNVIPLLPQIARNWYWAAVGRLWHYGLRVIGRAPGR